MFSFILALLPNGLGERGHHLLHLLRIGHIILNELEESLEELLGALEIEVVLVHPVFHDIRHTELHRPPNVQLEILQLLLIGSLWCWVVESLDEQIKKLQREREESMLKEKKKRKKRKLK